MNNLSPNPALPQEKEILIFPGLGMGGLTSEICQQLNVEMGKIETVKFANGELKPIIGENVRERRVFVVQSTDVEDNHNKLAYLLILLDALKNAKAHPIHAIIPYFSYGRQEKKRDTREPKSMRLFAKLIIEAGATYVLCVDLHSDTSLGFFPNESDDHIYGYTVLIPEIKKIIAEHKPDPESLVVVSPDVGRLELNRDKYARKLGIRRVVYCEKETVGENRKKINAINGEIRSGDFCLLGDDMVDTGGSICDAARLLKEHGAAYILGFATHPELSADAIEKIEKSPIDLFLFTNTIAIPPEKMAKATKIKVVSIAPALADCIHRFSKKESISELLK